MVKFFKWLWQWLGLSTPEIATVGLNGGIMATITISATGGDVLIPIHGFDSEGNDTGLLGNGWSFTDISLSNPDIVTVADEGHGNLVANAGTPVGTGTCDVTFNAHVGDGPNRPGAFTIVVVAGDVATVGPVG